MPVVLDLDAAAAEGNKARPFRTTTVALATVVGKFAEWTDEPAAAVVKGVRNQYAATTSAWGLRPSGITDTAALLLAFWQAVPARGAGVVHLPVHEAGIEAYVCVRAFANPANVGSCLCATCTGRIQAWPRT